MNGQFGPMLDNEANKTDAVDSEVQYEFSSGLTRPDAFYDWPAQFEKILGADDYDAVVLFFGGNENRAMLIDGSAVDPSTTEWEEEYAKRVDALMTQLTDDGVHVYWMGMPVVSSDTLQERMELFNSIYAERAEQHPGVTFVPSVEVFAGPDGGYAEFLPNDDGDMVDMRLDDGIHLTTAGGIRLAKVVLEQLREDWSLPPVS